MLVNRTLVCFLSFPRPLNLAPLARASRQSFLEQAGLELGVGVGKLLYPWPLLGAPTRHRRETVCLAPETLLTSEQCSPKGDGLSPLQ